MSRVQRWIVPVCRLILVAALIAGWFVAVQPGQGRPDWFPEADKLRHMVAFLGFTVLVIGAQLQPRWLWLFGVFAYGIAIEWAQSQVPGRSASVADAVADGLGVLLGAWLVPRLLQRWLTP